MCCMFCAYKRTRYQMNVYRPIDPPEIYYIIMAYKGPLYSDDVKYKDTQKSGPNDLKKKLKIFQS